MSASSQTEDLISNVPDVVTDKILECLPIRMAARTSVLSQHWRRKWLSLKRLNFDSKFFREQISANVCCGSPKCSNIISSILLHHDGPVHDFTLEVPVGSLGISTNPSQWLSFLSKNGVRRIKMENRSIFIMCMSSHIFLCSELVELHLNYFALNPPPTGFTGFSKLKHLVLLRIEFVQHDLFSNLLTKCPMLASLRLEDWRGMDHVAINAPSLETLTLNGCFASLAFIDVRSLKTLSVSLDGTPQTPMACETLYANLNLLASSCQLQCIQFNGLLCKYLAAGGIAKRIGVTFNHLKKLCLRHLDFRDLRVVLYVFDMVGCCPYIQNLEISVISTGGANQYEFDYNKDLKLDQLLEIKIVGIMSSIELKLIEYLLAISGVLKKLAYKFGNLNTKSELKMLRALTEFPRASPKARLVSL